MENPDLKENCRKFDEAVISKLGNPATETNFPDEDLTLTYYSYAGDMTQCT